MGGVPPDSTHLLLGVSHLGLPVRVVAFQLLIGSGQLAPGRGQIILRCGQTLLQVRHVCPVQSHDLVQLLLGNIRQQCGDVFSFHVVSFLPTLW